MMSKAAVNIAVSALAIGTTMVACKPAAQSARISSASTAVPASQAADFHARAKDAAAKGDVRGALRFAEQAVEAAPRDAAYRLTLGDLYLKNGRFQSAETSFNDVLSLDPGNGRAGIGLALSRIALGKTVSAIAGLDSIASSAPAADVGLAYALAGQPQRALEILEPAARAGDASPRTRQNLALAYAIAGDWQKAHAVAAQDVAPSELGARMAQWARFTKPSAPWSQVASLLGVTPVADEGQPVRLALAPPAAPNEAFGMAETPAAIPASAPAESAPAAFAQAEPAPVPVSAPAPAAAAAPSPDAEVWNRGPVEETRPVYAAAVQSMTAPAPSADRPARESVGAPVIPFEPRKPKAPAHRASGGNFVVQLGAFANSAGVERAWAQAYKRYGFGDQTPLSTTIKVGGRVFHRLSVSGFDNRSEAVRACGQVRAKGGSCFVRSIAGDAPTRWASRYATRRPA